MTKEQWLFLFNSFASTLFKNKNKPVKKILVVRLDEIGDMVVSLHVFTLLKRQYPDARIDVLCKPIVIPLIKNNPFINKIYTDPDEWKSRYDVVVELRGTWRTLLKAFRYPPAYRVDRGTVRLKNRKKQKHEYETQYEVIKPLLEFEGAHEKPIIFTSSDNEESVNNFLNNHGIKKFAILHTGARRELRRWPSNRFALLADWLYKHYTLDLIFAGVAEDEAQIQEITAQMQSPFYLFTRGFNLCDFAMLCKKASLFIGNESGPLQIAAACNTPLVGLFGPGVPNVFYPINYNSKVIHPILDCNPCDQIHCIHPENPCINLIEIEDVIRCIGSII